MLKSRVDLDAFGTNIRVDRLPVVSSQDALACCRFESAHGTAG